MNNWIKYFGLRLVTCIGILIVSCGPSSSEKEETDDNNNFYNQSIEPVDLENDSLSDIYIKAFEKRAIQKLQDLKDYFEILSNSRIDSTFKNQAVVMANELFVSEENTITISLDENQESAIQKIDSFFISLQKGTHGMLSFEFHEVSVIKNIKPINSEEYKGAIRFRLFILIKQGNKEKLINKINMKCEIIAKRVRKKFGNESKQVWEVFLGDIFQIQ